MANGAHANLSVVPSSTPDASDAASAPEPTALEAEIGRAAVAATSLFTQALLAYVAGDKLGPALHPALRMPVSEATAVLYMLRSQSGLGAVEFAVVVRREYRRLLEIHDPAGFRQHGRTLLDFLADLLAVIDRVAVIEAALGPMPAARH